MTVDTNKPSARKWWRWFDPRAREIGTLAFILNRLSALGLTFYLFLHLIVLGQLARGPNAYDDFLATIRNPLFISGELLVVIASFYHGLNGIRIALATFGNASPRQKQYFYITLAITVIISLVFAIRMFTA
jgi:succinate dehydrogenase / fumarate reductase cytochrome b subunit